MNFQSLLNPEPDGNNDHTASSSSINTPKLPTSPSSGPGNANNNNNTILHHHSSVSSSSGGRPITISDVIHNANSASHRNSINLITNDEDVDINTKVTSPSITRRKSSLIRVKPRRYKEIPIYARRWKRSTDANVATTKGSSDSKSEALISGLLPSFSSVIPYEDQTRQVVNWLYSHLSSLPKSHLQYIELELKLGKIIDLSRDERLNLPILNEAILSGEHRGITFMSGISKRMYDSVTSYLNTLNSSAKSERAKFSIESIHQLDKIYSFHERNTEPQNIRISSNAATPSQPIASIIKKRISNLCVHNPNSLTDYRISLSLEIPEPEASLKFRNKEPQITRDKVRTSFKHAGTKQRVDLTVIKQDSAAGNGHTDGGVKHEVEIELDSKYLADTFVKLQDSSLNEAGDGNGGNSNAGQVFEEFIKVFLDNGRLLVRRIGSGVP